MCPPLSLMPAPIRTWFNQTTYFTPRPQISRTANHHKDGWQSLRSRTLTYDTAATCCYARLARVVHVSQYTCIRIQYTEFLTMVAPWLRRWLSTGGSWVRLPL